MQPIRMLDLHAEFEMVGGAVREAIEQVLSSQMFIGGREVEELETRLAAFTGVRRAVGVASGTDALLTALTALGIGTGDEVITTPYTFYATAGAIARVGAKPVFVDIDSQTLNLSAEGVARAVNGRTRAILPVHIYGTCADMDELLRIAKSKDLRVIEDAAQALGSEYRGRPAGSMGDVACLSFYPSKSLGAFGEGGMVLTNSDEHADKVAQLRNHGLRAGYRRADTVGSFLHEIVGGNHRLDTLQAAILLAKLRWLPEFLERRRAIAAVYDEGFRDVPGIRAVRPPADTCSCYHKYGLLVGKGRNELQAHLASQGIQTGLYYNTPLHLQPCFAHLGYQRGDLPICEQVCDQILCLPVHPGVTREQATRVIEATRQFCKRQVA